MKIKGLTITTIFVMLVGVCGVAQSADQDVLQKIELERKYSREQIKELMSTNLKLNEEEGAKFWPVYESYQDDLKLVNDKVLALIVEYADAYRGEGLKDEQALSLVKQYLDAEEDKVQLKKNYFKKMKKTLPGKKMAAFYQLDNRIDALIKVGHASQIPLIEP